MRCLLPTQPAMHKILLLVSIIGFSSYCESQNLLPSSARNPQLNSNNDPVTNIMDPDGMKQGFWYYEDIFDSAFVRIEYYDNEIVSTSYPSSDKLWVKAESWEQNMEVLTEIKKEVQAFMKVENFTLNDDQQFALLFNDASELYHFSPIGNWTKNSASQFEKAIDKKFKPNAKLSITTKAFILF